MDFYIFKKKDKTYCDYRIHYTHEIIKHEIHIEFLYFLIKQVSYNDI